MRASALVLIALLAGCHSYKAVTVPDAHGETVRIRFDQPTDVRVTGAGDSTRIVSVRELEGHVSSVQTDSIRLVIYDGEVARGRSVADGDIAMIPRTSTLELERRRISTSRSFVAVTGGLAAAALVFVFVNAVIIN